MIDSREAKENNVSIREKWSGNGYKEEAAIERDRQREHGGQIEPGEPRQKWDFCKCKLFFNIIINRSQISKRQFGLKQWTVMARVLSNPFDVLQVPLFP